MTARTWIITGASAGIGYATALAAIRAGDTVYGVARRVEKMAGLVDAGGHALAMDITEEDDLQHVVQTVADEQGRIDVLVNNAGTGIHGSIEETPMEQARQVMDVNLFGLARLTQLVLPHLRAQSSGTIVNISSIGGEIALPLGAWYYASKHALEAFSDTLRVEVAPFGIRVVIVQPGIIKTGFESETPRQLREISGHGAYAPMALAMADRAEGAFDSDSKASDPSVVAGCILRAVSAEKPKTRYVVGYLGKLLLRLNRWLPDKAYDKLISRQK